MTRIYSSMAQLLNSIIIRIKNPYLFNVHTHYCYVREKTDVLWKVGKSIIFKIGSNRKLSVGMRLWVYESN